MIDTKPQLDTAEDLLAALLTGTVDALELPAELAAAAGARYREVGEHLVCATSKRSRSRARS